LHKRIEKALRFGHTILIEDADNFDHLVMPILKKDYQKIGGREIAVVKKTEIDVSPSFGMYVFWKVILLITSF
jgi:dynein heavy chain 1